MRAFFESQLFPLVSTNLMRVSFITWLLVCLFRVAVFAEEPDLVAIQSVDPTIMVELRYATARNIVRRAIYPADMPALLRPQVAAQLAKAQGILRESHYGLKVWDAYRPNSAHEQLWRLAPNGDYVADPAAGGSLHTWGVAVDATLVDQRGRAVEMPTDFDDFTMASMLQYTGKSRSVRQNLTVLQNAMARAGFYGVRTEWWHFVARDWKNYKAIPEFTIFPRGPAVREPGGATVNAPSAPLRALPVSPTHNFPSPSASIPAAHPRSAGQ